ncbi:putative CyP450 monooxygenase [Mycena floridula]|nr:putative CyP450 monooxygenase [Mycena floridula]
MTAHFALAAVAVVLVWQLLQRFRKRARLPYPPGPKGLSFLGNIDIPSKHQWLRLAELTEQYGDIFSLTMLGQKIIVLGSVEATTDLFEKRSTNYASRPEAHMFRHLMGFHWSMAVMPYSDIWKHQRKIFENYFRQREIPKFHQTLTREVHMTLYRLLQAPELFLEHCRLLFGAVILDIVYGLGHTGHQDPIFVNGERVMQTLGEVTVPGRFWVDIMPLMRYIPAWMPGAGFQRKARLWRSWGEDFLNVPWNRVKENIKNGEAQPSFASKMIEEMDTDGTGALEEDIFKPVAALGYAGGSDTTVATLQSIFLAMCLYPDVQKRAQAELDRVVGDQRLPTFDDQPQLPYINALMKEAIRWMPVLPLAIPHLTLKDDVYRGYFIPKDSLVIGNSWKILHDSQLYGPNTEEFSPERFLSEDGQLNPNIPDSSFAFGYGRITPYRRCPGRHLSDATLFIAVACILHTFSITPPLDANGIEIRLEAQQCPTILAPPEKFSCVIKPRSEAAAALVENLGF